MIKYKALNFDPSMGDRCATLIRCVYALTLYGHTRRSFNKRPPLGRSQSIAGYDRDTWVNSVCALNGRRVANNHHRYLLPKHCYNRLHWINHR